MSSSKRLHSRGPHDYYCNSFVTCFSDEVGLLDLARMTIAEHFEERVGRAGSRVEIELAHAANRVNYNQVRR